MPCVVQHRLRFKCMSQFATPYTYKQNCINRIRLPTSDRICNAQLPRPSPSLHPLCSQATSSKAGQAVEGARAQIDGRTVPGSRKHLLIEAATTYREKSVVWCREGRCCSCTLMLRTLGGANWCGAPSLFPSVPISIVGFRRHCCVYFNGSLRKMYSVPRLLQNSAIHPGECFVACQ